MAGQVLHLGDVFSGTALLRANSWGQEQEQPATPWCWEELRGRLVEISGHKGAASLTVAFGLVVRAQLAGEPVAWVSAREDLFFPPDAAEGGADLGALPVVRVSRAQDAARVADKLLRSGAFGLVVLDLPERAELPMPLQGRILKLAETHEAAVVCVTRKREQTPSLSSLVSLRVESIREHIAEGRFACMVRAIKDKRRGPGWDFREVCRGPAGLR